MKRRFLTLLILPLAIIGSVQAQHRMWGNPIGPYAYNPAGANVNDMGEIIASYYMTYVDAKQAPQGALLLGSTSLPFDNMGAGFRFDYETGGVMKSIMAEATYVYKLNIGRQNKLAFGLSGTYNQTFLDRSKVVAKDGNDPFLVSGTESDFWFDFNFGVSFYKPNHYYVGLAAYNIAGGQSTADWKIAGFEERTSRLFTASGMYMLDFVNGDLKLELTANGMFYLPQDKFTLVYDANARAIYKKICWLGTGYTENMVKVLAGVYVQNFSIGYAGGIGVANDITTYSYSFPRHEVFLRLELNTSKSSKNKR